MPPAHPDVIRRFEAAVNLRCFQRLLMLGRRQRSLWFWNAVRVYNGSGQWTRTTHLGVMNPTKSTANRITCWHP